MNPALILQLLQVASQAAAMVPQVLQEYQAVKDSLSSSDQAAIEAQIESLEAQRKASWAAADTALEAAAKT